MANLFVRPNNAVEHNGVRFEAGEQITGDVSEKEAQALLDAGVVSEQKEEAAAGDHEPTEEEVAAAAAAAGQTSEQKKGLFR